ncbi:MAG TPA: hypothetical protein VN619_04030 [Lacisediminihabitans sp.]|jgi:hypothetical protein|nr:hypothetical protein [Lacisediminihabitans sp.]HXD61078.1 hypothetical protein [Lacisediminihabitans sp.]
MQWWNNFVDWFGSDDGWRVFSTAILPFIAIIVAGAIAAGIGRASTRRVIALSDREVRIAAVTTLLSAARRASIWNTLSAGEQPAADQAAIDAEIRLRLLGVPGAALASEWTAHEIADMKRNSVSFSFQAEQTLLVVRDRLIEWQARPSRAKRLFKNDLDTWAYESSLSDQDLVHQQKAWSAQQAATSTVPTGTSSTAATTSTASSTPSTAPTAAPRSSLAPSLSEPEVQASTPAKPAQDEFLSRPVSATDVSKRIAPPEEDPAL